MPSLLAACHGTCLLDAALGMDSFLVMRHGAGPPLQKGGAAEGGAAAEPANDNPRLGCYFCNDVVAPQDSTRDRTLDQMCTVTRPGLAPIAAALAAELAVALLHHPLRHRAPADAQGPALAPASGGGGGGGDPAKPLGCLPHQLRGSLATFGLVHPMAHAFEHCTACNPKVCQAYRQQGFGLVKAACADASLLGRVSGLEAFQAECDALETDFALDDDDDF